MAILVEEGLDKGMEDTKITLGWVTLPLIIKHPDPNKNTYLLNINGMQLECEERFIVNLTKAGLRALKAYNGLPKYDN